MKYNQLFTRVLVNIIPQFVLYFFIGVFNITFDLTYSIKIELI